LKLGGTFKEKSGGERGKRARGGAGGMRQITLVKGRKKRSGLSGQQEGSYYLTTGETLDMRSPEEKRRRGKLPGKLNTFSEVSSSTGRI